MSLILSIISGVAGMDIAQVWRIQGVGGRARFCLAAVCRLTLSHNHHKCTERQDREEY